MTPVTSALLAMLFYAVQNVLLERKLAGVHPLLVSGVAAVVMATCAWGTYLNRSRLGLVVAMPGWQEIAIIAGAGVILFCAELAYINAYYGGGSLATVTTMVILIPVFASAIKFALSGGYPHPNEFFGYMFAAAAVLLVASVPPASPPH